MALRLFFVISLCICRLSLADVTELSASLLFHVNEQIDDWNGDAPISIPFTETEEEALWSKLRDESDNDACVEHAYKSFTKAKKMPAGQGIQHLKDASLELTAYWKSTQPDYFEVPEYTAHSELSKYSHGGYPISPEALDDMQPYLLPRKHKLAEAMDKLFGTTRVTKDMQTFEAAGFNVLHVQPRSFILVASHKKLPGHLLKVYLDDEERTKQNKPGWKWFVYRCRGAEKIADIIEKKGIKYFTVPKKYIYILPEKPAAPHGQGYKPKIAVLLVEDMNIMSNEDNEEHWRTAITKDHLFELYTIISRANGASYRAGNIPFTKTGKIAFVDTEYPYRKPDYKSIRNYLSNEMRDKWDSIVRHKGKL